MADRKAVIIYDGDGALGRRFARWVHRKDHAKRLDLIPFQEPNLESRFPRVSRERCREELHLIDDRGHIFVGAAAVRETLARLPAAPVMTLPFHAPGGMWLANWIYRWVARNRGWLSRWLAPVDDRGPTTEDSGNEMLAVTDQCGVRSRVLGVGNTNH